MFTAALLATMTLVSAPSGSLVVLLQEGDVDANWGNTIRDAAKAATRGAKTKWVKPPAAALEDAQLMLGCSALDAECIGKVAGLVSADVALFGKLSTSGESVVVELSLVSAKGKESEKARYELPANALGLVEQLVTSHVKDGPSTHVVLESSPAGAVISIDGADKGKGNVVLVGLSAGAHEVVVKLEGYDELKQKLVVEAGRTTRATLTLTKAEAVFDDPDDNKDPKKDPLLDDKTNKDPIDKLPDPVEPTPSPGLGAIPWVVMGAGIVVAGVGAGVYGLYFQQYEGITDELLLRDELIPRQGLTTAENNARQSAFNSAFDTKHGDIVGTYVAAVSLIAAGVAIAGSGVGLLFVE